VDALVIAGDLYDGDQTSMKTARLLATQMERLHQAGGRASGSNFRFRTSGSIAAATKRPAALSNLLRLSA
jgi:DNA repair exonuclease SbcCD nuclease subunit